MGVLSGWGSWAGRSGLERATASAPVAGREPRRWLWRPSRWAMESAESVSPCRVSTFLRETPGRGPLWEFRTESEAGVGRGSQARRQQGRNLARARLKSRMKSG